MTDGLVQQHSRPARSEDNFHLACRCFARVQLQNCLPCGLLGEKLGVFSPKKKSSATRPPPRSRRGQSCFSLGNAGNVHARERLGVLSKRSVRSDDQNVA